MSRLQKKCFLGATTMHALLLLALVVGPAFFTKQEEPLDLQEITIEPSILTDEKLFNPGGASPGGQTQTPPEPQVQQPVAQPQPQPRPPTPEPLKQEEVVDPEPVKQAKQPPKTVETDEPKINDRDSDKVQKPKPKQVVVSNKKVKLTDKTSTSTAKQNSSTKSDSNTSNNSALASAIRSTKTSLGTGLSSGTDIKMPPGQGGGSGASYANYAQEIQRRYKAAYDRALLAAGDIADGQAQVETSIVILNNGTIVNSSIVKPSGNAALDGLTRRVLDSIREVPPFPAGAKDSRRTFNIIFDLKPKINVG